MWKIFPTSVLGAIACVVVTAANAAAADVVDVKVPFPFVANGQNFPAGQYTIERAGMGTSVLLIRGDRDNRAAAFVSTTPADGRDPAGDKPALTFTRHENQYRLSAVWESATEGQKLMR